MMNPTRNFLLARAAAIVAQLQDKPDPPIPPADVDARVALRLEYMDLRAAMRRVSCDPTLHSMMVDFPDSLWAEHCRVLGLDPHHDARNL